MDLFISDYLLKVRIEAYQRNPNLQLIIQMNKDKEKKTVKKGKSKDTFRQELTEKQKKDIK